MSNLLKTLLLIAIIGGGFFLWKKYFYQDSVTQLSKFIDNHIDVIFSPLSGDPSPIPTHEIRMLKEQFKDNKNESVAVATSAIRLCETLLIAIEIREKHLLRLKGAEGVTESSLINNPVQRAKNKEERRIFFTEGVNRSWMHEAQRLRQKINIDYALLRSREREKPE